MAEQDAGAVDTATEGTDTSIDATMEAVWDRMENGSRDDAGKFTSEDGADTGDTTQTADTADTDSTDQPAAKADTGADKTPTDAPNSWSAEDKAAFAKAPPEVQKTILKRETERDNLLTQKTQEIATERKQYEPYKPVIAPIEAEARKYGMTGDVAIKQLFERHMDIAQNGIEGLKRVAAVYGLKLSEGDADNTYIDPETAALKNEIHTLKSTVTGWQQAQAKQQEVQVNSEIDSVRLQKAKDGSLVRPHFDAVFEDMIPIATDLRAKNPSWSPSKVAAEAYDRAVHANPDTRAKLAAEQAAKAKADAEKEIKEAAAKAKKAAANNTRSSTAHPGGGTASKSMEDTMGRIYDSMNAA